MPGNRKAAQKIIMEWIDKLDPSGKNAEMYTEMFKNMSDKQFDAYMKAIENGEDYVSMVMPNLVGKGITTENNMKVAKEMGYPFFQRLWLTDDSTGMVYRTNKRYLVMHLPVRRQIQTLVNKISIPEDNRHVDELTDQPVGVSKGSSLSLPELLVLYGQGMENGILEMIKFRGGDLKAMNAMDKEIIQSGSARMETISKLGTSVKSTQTLSIFFKAMHLDNNL